MKDTSDKIAAIGGQPQADQGATLAGLNAQMNQYSMTRQAITNSVRDIMSMVEEMSNLENSLYSKKDREAGLYRWA